jgi:hypothetical protein
LSLSGSKLFAMCDFLVSCGRQYNGKKLLDLIKKPYGERAPEGRSFDFPWGSAAILQDQIANGKNIFVLNGMIFAWIGDLVTRLPDKTLEGFLKNIESKFACSQNCNNSLKSDEYFSMLNGAFAIIVLHNKGFNIITDALNYTQVYIGRKETRGILVVGTHPDLVACASENLSDLDIRSVGEFLNSGRATFPNTMFHNVKQIEPGSLHIFSSDKNKVEITSWKYWSPPKEMEGQFNKNELAEELRGYFLSAVRRRCEGKKVAISLSGGLDSRLIIASVPKEIDCIGLTFCDQLNREAITARRVACCYNRPWYPLYRDKEYIADNAVKTIMFTGCESDWIHAHSVGFAEAVSSNQIDAFLGGDLVGCYLRAPLAADFIKKQRMKGIFVHKYEKVGYDYIQKVTNFTKQYLAEDIIEGIYTRRIEFYDKNFDACRSSIAEWLEVYPFSQRPEISTWVAERRLLPSRPVGMDKELLDIAFKIPTILKLDDKIFYQAAMNIYGKGNKIPNANDGVRPGSGHWSRLWQRAIRKLQDKTTTVLEMLDKKPRVQHSWHDYQKYWTNSVEIAHLIQTYGVNLNEFDYNLFKERAITLLESKDLSWREGFRLLQLAVWKGILNDYKQLKPFKEI